MNHLILSFRDPRSTESTRFRFGLYESSLSKLGIHMKFVRRSDVDRGIFKLIEALRHLVWGHSHLIGRQDAKLKAQGIQAFSYEFLGGLADKFQSQGPTQNAAEPHN